VRRPRRLHYLQASQRGFPPSKPAPARRSGHGIARRVAILQPEDHAAALRRYRPVPAPVG
jgi:hypothetical protein